MESDAQLVSSEFPIGVRLGSDHLKFHWVSLGSDDLKIIWVHIPLVHITIY